MSSQQRGWYIDMLCWCWQENGMDANALRSLCTAGDIDACSDFSDLKEAFDAVLSHFTATTIDGRISHPKLEELRLSVSQRSEKASDSANKRWHKKGSAEAMRSHCEGNARASNSLSKSLSESGGSVEGGDYLAQFSESVCKLGFGSPDANVETAYFTARISEVCQQAGATPQLGAFVAANFLKHQRFQGKPLEYLIGALRKEFATNGQNHKALRKAVAN